MFLLGRLVVVPKRPLRNTENLVTNGAYIVTRLGNFEGPGLPSYFKN